MQNSVWKALQALLALLVATPWLVFADPSPRLMSPSNGAVINPGQAFDIAAQGFDATSPLAGLELYQDHVLVGSFTTTYSAVLTWSNTVVGLHTYFARALYEGGYSLTSSFASVFVPATNSVVTFFPDFMSTEGLILLGQATNPASALRLSSTNRGSSGGAWLPALQPLLNGFETFFTFQITDLINGGADGFAFVIQGTPTPTLTGGGGAIGYDGITNSLAVEFDTYLNTANSDPNGNHISVHSQGLITNTALESASLGNTTSIPNMSDGAIHTARITYSAGKLRIYLDNLQTAVLTVNVNLSTYLSLPGGRAWIGLTASCGARMENHDILSWAFTSVSTDPPQILSSQKQEDGTFALEFTTISMRDCQIEYSADLATWSPTHSATIGTGTTIRWLDIGPTETDSLPSDEPQRFYRIRLLP